VLHLAVTCERPVETIRRMTKHGVDPTIPNDRAEAALDVAVEKTVEYPKRLAFLTHSPEVSPWMESSKDQMAKCQVSSLPNTSEEC
jgi:hypothetical protein